jgi:hypothetical protein
MSKKCFHRVKLRKRKMKLISQWILSKQSTVSPSLISMMRSLSTYGLSSRKINLSIIVPRSIKLAKAISISLRQGGHGHRK